jgi:preprotein translocase subunit YajC
MDNAIPVIELFTTTVVRLALLAQAAAPGAGDGTPQDEFNIFTSFFGNPVNLLMLAVMLFFFIVIWPQQRQAKSQQLAHEQALAGMKKNDRVITSGGIHGVIIQANSDEPVITIRIDENSGARMTVNRDAIVKVFTET